MSQYTSKDELIKTSELKRLSKDTNDIESILENAKNDENYIDEKDKKRFVDNLYDTVIGMKPIHENIMPTNNVNQQQAALENYTTEITGLNYDEFGNVIQDEAQYETPIHEQEGPVLTRKKAGYAVLSILVSAITIAIGVIIAIIVVK